AHSSRSFNLLNFKVALHDPQVSDEGPRIGEVLETENAFPAFKNRDGNHVKLHATFALQDPLAHQDVLNILVSLYGDNLKTGLNSSPVNISFYTQHGIAVDRNDEHP